MSTLILPAQSRDGIPHDRRLLQRRDVCRGDAVGFLRRLLHPECRRPDVSIGDMITSHLPETLVAAGHHPGCADPTLMPLPGGLHLLRFSDDGILIAEPVGTSRRLRVLPLLLDATRQAFPERHHGAATGARDDTGAGLDAQDCAAPVMLETLAEDAEDWRRTFHAARRAQTRAWPAPFMDVKSTLSDKAEVDAQHWLGDLCSYLVDIFCLKSRLGVAFLKADLRQDRHGACYDLSLLSGTAPARQDDTSEALLTQMRRALDHPDADWNAGRILILHSPADGPLRRETSPGGQIFGMSEVTLSAHRRIVLRRRFDQFMIAANPRVAESTSATPATLQFTAHVQHTKTPAQPV